MDGGDWRPDEEAPRPSGVGGCGRAELSRTVVLPTYALLASCTARVRQLSPSWVDPCSIGRVPRVMVFRVGNVAKTLLGGMLTADCQTVPARP